MNVLCDPIILFLDIVPRENLQMYNWEVCNGIYCVIFFHSSQKLETTQVIIKKVEQINTLKYSPTLAYDLTMKWMNNSSHINLTDLQKYIKLKSKSQTDTYHIT